MTRRQSTEAYLARIVDEEALASYLERTLHPADSYSVEYHDDGHSNETLFVTWGNDDLVIRRPPPGEVASNAHDVLREYRVIDALQKTDVPVPPTVAACDDHSVIGSDFYIMAAVSGDVIRTQVPPRFQSAGARQRLGQELVDGLAAVHAVDPAAVDLEDFGHPEGFTGRQVERWTEQLEWAIEVTADYRSVPKLDTVTEWLREHCPGEHPHTLVHGDYKLDNIMFGPGTPPEIASIFDWELSTLGDPLTDLGWMLSFWWDEKDPEAPASTGDLYPTFMRHSDFPTRRELVDRYERQTGYSFDNQQFYHVLGVYKLAVLGEMFYRRHLEGNADDDLYPKMEAGVPEMAARARRMIDGNEPL